MLSGKQEPQESETDSIAKALAGLKELQVDLGKTGIDEYREMVLDWHKDDLKGSKVLKKFKEYDALRDETSIAGRLLSAMTRAPRNGG